MKLEKHTPEEVEQNQLYKEMGLSEEEYLMAKKIMGRIPSYTETGIFSVMWSEHCSYKTSKPLLKKFPTEGKHVLMGPGEGAGVVDIGDEQAVVFKVESHNHPSTIDPYEGAATGVGGILRDVFSMGARPIAAMNSLRFGNLGNKRTNYLFQEVVRGIAGYGNAVGVPTVGGEVQFDECYKDNPLVNAMVVGLINHEDIQKGIAKGVGNTVIYAGAPTGRDGIHGATHSSDDKASEEASPAAGNPLLEKRLIEACLEVTNSDALVGMQDMGAAGLTSSGSEMASKAGTGMVLDLDHIPQAEDRMSAYEMMLSETQERMLLVVKKGREQEIIDVFKEYDLEAVAVGEVIEEEVFRVKHQDEILANIPASALDEEAPVYYLPTSEPESYRKNNKLEVNVPIIKNYGETLKQLLKQPTIASKKWVYDQFNYETGGNTVVAPGAGAAIVRIKDKNKAIAITTDCNSRYIYLDPEVGGKIAVAEAARNIVCSGARPLALTDGLNFGNPTNPEIFWQMEKSIDGISEACRVLDTPVISGNVSMYNQSEDKAIFPTPIIGMVGLIDDLDDVTPNHFQTEGDLIYLVGETGEDFGGSELQNLLQGQYSGKAPAIDLAKEQNRQNDITKAIEDGYIVSATDLSEGGLATALAISCVTGDLGAEIDLEGEPGSTLFSETQSRFLLTVKEDDKEKIESLMGEATLIGSVVKQKTLQVNVSGEAVIEEKLDEISKLWKEAIPNSLKSNE